MPQRGGGWCEPLQECIEPGRELLHENAAYACVKGKRVNGATAVPTAKRAGRGCTVN